VCEEEGVMGGHDFFCVLALLIVLFGLCECELRCQKLLRKNDEDIAEILKGIPRPPLNQTSGISHIFNDLRKFRINKNSSGCYNWDCKSPQRVGEKCIWCLPRIYVAGVSKCGTTAICRKLAAHPNVKPYRKKEINIFTKYINHSWAFFERKIVDTHPNSHGEIWLDCSSGAFRDFNVAAHLAKYSKSTKIIFMVRDPWQRLGSYLAMLKRNNDEEKYNSMVSNLFEKWKTHVWTDYVRMHPRGVYHFAKVNDFFYAEIIMNWMSVIPLRRMMAVDQYDLERSPAATMRSVEDFLKLPHHEYDNETLVQVSKNAVRKIGNSSVDSSDFEFVQKRNRAYVKGRVERYNSQGGEEEEGQMQIHAPYAFEDDELKKLTRKLFRPSLCLFRAIFKWDIKIITEGIL
jgi:hypothetical protein